MTAPVVQLADAIRAALDGAPFSPPFSPTRKYAPRVDLKDADSLHVFVVPKAVSTSVESRDAVQDILSVDVGFVKKVADDDEVDSLMGLVSDVAAWFSNREIEGFDGKWVDTSIDPLFVMSELVEKQQFLSVVTVSYRLIRKGA